MPTSPARWLALSAALLSAALASKAPASTPFTLTLHTQEAKLENGKVSKQDVVKTWTLNAADLTRSRAAGHLSAGLQRALDHIQHQVESRQPAPAVFRNEHGHWVARQQNGWTLDRHKTDVGLLNTLLAGGHSAEAVVALTAPQRSVQLLAGRGVLSFVSSGHSSYRGSPTFRETNVLVGASKLDNFFIAPGHTFDFAKEVGSISAATGFVKGYVISGGTLQKEDGGGICQVSTTVFRALYQAGLPIVERHEHSHRVDYYDPVGFEATVYAPEKNLRMKNDTAAYLFVQASWDKKAKTLTFDLFGAAPTRTVKLSKPVVSDFKFPSQPTYSPDPRVRVGSRRVLDVEVQGMTSVITRSVTRNGHTTKDTLKSVYRPWGKVYGVAPGDSRLR